MADENEPDFGRYLVSVEERDIDLLLMEEFQITDEFVEWFAKQLGMSSVVPAGAWHSVYDADGETDLLLRVRSGGLRIGILIENKIAAAEQERQSERYHIRGTRARDAGKFDGYVTVICAPQEYLDGLPSHSAYQHRVSYEAIARWFASREGRREVWRRRIFEEAIEHSRRGYVMVVSTTNTDFQDGYWKYLQQKHPLIHMNPPREKGAYSNWIVMKGHDFPKGVHLHFKIKQRAMELGFDRRTVEEILAVRTEWPDGIVVIQSGRTATLMIEIPHIDMTASIASQIDAIEEALRAAYKLMPYAQLLLPPK